MTLLHADAPNEWGARATVVVGLVVVGVVYATGWRRYRSRVPGRSARFQLAAFVGGLACLWVAIASPLDEAADAYLSAHMVQHLLLLMAAPALLLLGDPLLPMLRGLPNVLRQTVAAPLRWRALRTVLHALTHPLLTLLLSSLVFWSWHSPVLYQRALRVPAIHLVEHASFFVVGALFWYPVVQPWPSRPRWPRGAMIPYLLIADVQNTLLAAVLTFSDRVLYPLYALRNGTTTIAALDDQVLAGVIMWVPMSLAYLVPAVLLSVRLLSPGRQRSRSLFAHTSTRPGELRPG